MSRKILNNYIFVVIWFGLMRVLFFVAKFLAVFLLCMLRITPKNSIINESFQKRGVK